MFVGFVVRVLSSVGSIRAFVCFCVVVVVVVVVGPLVVHPDETNPQAPKTSMIRFLIPDPLAKCRALVTPIDLAWALF